jgi:hypothetical protein
MSDLEDDDKINIIDKKYGVYGDNAKGKFED